MAKMERLPRLSPANLFDLPAFVVTSQVRQVIDLCDALRQSRTLGLLTGTPGVGKTWAAQYAAQQQQEPEEITASPMLYTTIDVQNTPRALLGNLLDCLGPDYRAPVPDMARLACCWVHRRQVELIILDEADRLNKASLEVIQDIHDRTRCAFLFVGQLTLDIKLRRYKQLLNRIGLAVELRPLTFDEMVEFLAKWQYQRDRSPDRTRQAEFALYLDSLDSYPEDLLIVKEIYRVTLGNLRRIVYFIQEVQRIGGLNGHYYVELPVVQATAQLMAGELAS
jgi:DNA transposition AAA+ family ATPase